MNWLTSRWALWVAATLALASCDKGTDLNVDLPDTTAINTEYRDFALDVATVRLAPVQTLKTDHFLVGRLADNVAGTTEARAYLNVVSGGITDSLPSKLPQPVLDSVVMVMGFDKVYGSATTPVHFDVYKLPTPLDERQVYDSDTSTPLGEALGQDLASRLDRTQRVTTPATATTPASTATVPDQTVRLLLHRRTPPAVTLPFATALFAQLSQPNFDQPQLDGLLKGLAVVPNANYTGSIVSFGRPFDSRLVVYFHAADTLRRTYSIYFGPVYSTRGAASARDPRYYTQLSSTLPSTLSALANRPGFVPSGALNGVSYIQEGTGLATRVTFKGLDELLRTPNLTVNRAELRVPVKPFSNALFPSPSSLYALEVDGSNNALQRAVNFIPSDRVVQADGFDQVGTGREAVSSLIGSTTSQSYYSLPITSYLQAYLGNKLGGNPASLVLVPNIRTSATLSLNRAALDAANLRLRVYYSKR